MSIAVGRLKKSGTQRPDAAISLDAVERGGGEDGQPQAAVGGEALLRARSSRRRSRLTSTGRPPAPEVASTSTSASSSAPVDPLDRGHDAGRGLVVRPGVDVDAGLGARRRRSVPGLGLDDRSARRGTGAFWVTLRELGGELAEGQVLGALADQAEGRDVPERGGRHRCRGRPRSRRAGRTGRPGPSRTDPTRFLHRRLAVRGAEHACGRARRGLDLRGADLAGARSRSARRRAAGRRGW